MPKASHVTSTPSVDRRSILAGAGGIAAAGALASLPALAAENSAKHSPEFLKWYALATRTGEALAASNTWEVEHIRQGKERPQTEDPISLHWEAMHALEEALFARPVRSWVDVGELAVIAFYWGDGGEPTSSSERWSRITTTRTDWARMARTFL
jgi:hypothetical protein